MAEPIVEQICSNVLSTLQGITVANGYQYDLIVEREARRGNQPRHLLVVLHQLDPQEVEDEVTLKHGWIQPFMLDVFISIPESDSTAPDLVLNRITADIHKALMVDRYRGGLALETMIRGWQAFATLEGDLEGREVRFDVQYRHAYTNPYTLG